MAEDCTCDSCGRAFVGWEDAEAGEETFCPHCMNEENNQSNEDYDRWDYYAEHGGEG